MKLRIPAAVSAVAVLSVVTLSACASTPEVEFATESERAYHMASSELESAERALREAQNDAERLEREQRDHQRDIDRAQDRLDRLNRREADIRRALTRAQAEYAAHAEAAERARLLHEADELEAQASANRAAAGGGTGPN